MKRFKQAVKAVLPQFLLTFVWRLKRKKGQTDYASIKLSRQDIRNGSYKKHFGGGGDAWDVRGVSQLAFLRQMGLRKASSLIDIGCGPGRASFHFITYLDNSKYYGIDYNRSFIRAAVDMCEANGVMEKHPSFKVVTDFNMEILSHKFDFAIAFSVLNHCTKAQRTLFFQNLQFVLKDHGKAYITHARWFEPAYLRNRKLKVTQTLNAKDLSPNVFGWKNGSDVFPVIEISKECV